jgi:hypothetical protein
MGDDEEAIEHVEGQRREEVHRTPSSVLGHHEEDEFAQLPSHASSARSSAMPRDPLPLLRDAS